MAQAEPVIRRSVSAEALEQLRPLAQRFRYVLVATPGEAGWDVHISQGAQRRPALRVV